jgi:hypothetical protein
MGGRRLGGYFIDYTIWARVSLETNPWGGYGTTREIWLVIFHEDHRFSPSAEACRVLL